jgi:tetratricopeptide (TPR) repeat protein
MAEKSLKGVTIGGCEVLDEIGSGGMGVIYRSRQVSLDRPVALKVLAPRLAGDHVFVERFFREAKAIARVNHPNILAVYDVGIDGDMAYMVMELVDGTSLNARLKEQGIFEPLMAADCIRQAAMGLAAAYTAGIIHRDIKPDNLMITRDGTVKVSDFGLAKEVETTQTETGMVMGTPAYMSPEQCDGKALDGRSDIYALGGTFFRIVTGRLPFEAETAMSMMYKHKHEALMPPERLNPAVPMSLSELIVRMMAKDREERPGSMAEVAGLIDEAVERAAEETPPVPQPPGEGQPGGGGARRPTSTRMPRATGVMKRFTEAPAEGAGDAPRKPGREDTRLFRREESGGRREESGGRRQERPSGRFKAVQADRSEAERQAEALKGWMDKGRELLGKGQYAEAARCFRAALEAKPANPAEIQTLLEQAEQRMITKRKATAELRALLQGSRFEEAVAYWDGLTEDLREGQLRTQLEHLRSVTIPAARLCNEGDGLLEKGALEAASAQYQKALEIEMECARAKQGMKEIGSRQQRISLMLKEGYEYQVREEFEQAIKAWSPILKLAPKHPQAVKYMIEAHLRAAHDQRSRGELDSAVRHWRELTQLAPDHAEGRKALQEDGHRLSSVNSLREAATKAQTARRLGAAARALQQALAVCPQSKSLRAELDRVRRRRRGQFIRRGAVATVLAAIAATAVIGVAQNRYMENLRPGASLADEAGAAPLSPAAREQLDLARRTIDEPGALTRWIRPAFVHVRGWDPALLESGVECALLMDKGAVARGEADKLSEVADQGWRANPAHPDDAAKRVEAAEGIIRTAAAAFDSAAGAAERALERSAKEPAEAGRWQQRAKTARAMKAWADLQTLRTAAMRYDMLATGNLMRDEFADMHRNRKECMHWQGQAVEFAEDKKNAEALKSGRAAAGEGDAASDYLKWREAVRSRMRLLAAIQNAEKKFEQKQYGAAWDEDLREYANETAPGTDHPAIQWMRKKYPSD